MEENGVTPIPDAMRTPCWARKKLLAGAPYGPSMKICVFFGCCKNAKCCVISFKTNFTSFDWVLRYEPSYPANSYHSIVSVLDYSIALRINHIVLKNKASRIIGEIRS